MATRAERRRPKKDKPEPGYQERDRREAEKADTERPTTAIFSGDEEDDNYVFEDDPDANDWYEYNRELKERKFLCATCQIRMKYERNGTYHCNNSICKEYLIQQEPWDKKLPTDSHGEYNISENLTDRSSPMFIGYNPDNGEFNGDTGKKLVYKSSDGRVQHIRYRKFPTDLSLSANTM